jgi:hypothetical protein
MTQPVSYALLGEVRPVGDPEDILDHARLSTDERAKAHNESTTQIKAFNHAIEEASRKTLQPKRWPNPKGARWWNDECQAACNLAHAV